MNAPEDSGQQDGEQRPEPAGIAEESDAKSGEPQNADAPEDAQASEKGAKERVSDDEADPDGLVDAERYLQWRIESLRDLSGTVSMGAGRDWIGRSTNRVSRDGAIYQAGGDVHISHSANADVPITYVSGSAAEELLACAVEPPSLRRLSRYLENKDLVYLAGPEGSGRMTGALVALLRWARRQGRSAADDNGEEHVGVIRGSGALATAPLSKLRPGNGYVLDWESQDWIRDAAHLRDLPMRAKARFVVLLPQSRTDLRGLIVEHQPPHAYQVFHRRLEYEARAIGVDPSLPDDIRKWVERELQDERLPYRGADMASRFATEIKAGTPFEEIIRVQPNALYERFRDQFDKGRPILGRCFAVAAAVLNDQAESSVSRAAMDLANRVDTAWNIKDEKRELPTWEQVCRWLEHSDASARSTSPGAGRVVRLNRKDAADVVLKVFWEEHAATREPLIEWLLDLGEKAGGQELVRVAHAVGTLARFDFDTIDARFIARWSGSRSTRDHQLAAFALEATAQEPLMHPKVHARLRGLAGDPRYGPRVVAAEAYGLRIGLGVDAALWELSKICTPLVVRLNEKAARSIGYLYRADTAELVLRELARWVAEGSGGGRYTAALAFGRLAMLPGGDPAQPAPHDLSLPDELTLLWRNALMLRLIPRGKGLSRLAVPSAWDVFGDWLTRYERPDTRAVVDQVIRAVDSDHLAMCLYIWRRKGLISTDLYDHLLKEAS